MQFKDYYKILGVDANADEKAIKTAYRRLARRYHPDISKEKDAEEQFKAVAEAYEVLKDRTKRSDYDELRKYGGQRGQSFTPPPGWQSSSQASGEQFSGEFSEFFENLFGSATQGRGRAREGASKHRGQDIEMELPVFLEDTVNEGTKTVRFEVPTPDSAGAVEKGTKTLNIKIPEGVIDGERIRLKGQGMPAMGSGEHGDLYLHIRLVPHPLFDVEGHNLIITVPLAPWEAALGSKITVPTLNGKIHLTIPAHTQSGQRTRIKGKGLPNKMGGVGDLYAVFNVVMPDKADESLTSLWKQLAERSGFNPRSEWSKA